MSKRRAKEAHQGEHRRRLAALSFAVPLPRAPLASDPPVGEILALRDDAVARRSRPTHYVTAERACTSPGSSLSAGRAAPEAHTHTHTHTHKHTRGVMGQINNKNL